MLVHCAEQTIVSARVQGGSAGWDAFTADWLAATVCGINHDLHVTLNGELGLEPEFEFASSSIEQPHYECTQWLSGGAHYAADWLSITV